jgi:hypothetical protein
MFYFQYLDSTQLKTDDNLQLFRTNKAGAITSDNVLRVCSVGKYKFDVVGLFSNLDSFIYEESFPYEVSEVGLNFRLFHLTQVVVLSVLVNDKLAYNMSLDTGFNVSVDIFP